MKSLLCSSSIPKKYAPPITANGDISKTQLCLQKTLAQNARVLKQCQHPKLKRPRRPTRTELPQQFFSHADTYLLAQQIFSQP